MLVEREMKAEVFNVERFRDRLWLASTLSLVERALSHQVLMILLPSAISDALWRARDLLLHLIMEAP